MGKFLNDFLLTMPETQRKKLMELLESRQRQGIIKSETELAAELERLLKGLDRRDGKPTFTPRNQSELTSSESYNANMQEIEFDLATLFDVSDQLDRLLTDNQQLTRSMLADIQKKIAALDSRLERHKLVMSNTDGFLSGVHEQFKAPQYTETSSDALLLLQKERQGNYLPPEYMAETVVDRLQLSSAQTIDQLKNPYGAKLARIEVKNRTGMVAGNPKYTIDYAIDSSQESFWAEVILADAPLEHNIDDIWNHDYKNTPTTGALCELEITLNGVTPVSEITFDPYCGFPMQIVSIHGYESSVYDGNVYELVTPVHESPYQRSQTSNTQMSFQFPSVEISKLRVLIRQENYAKENFIVNKDEANQAELWDKIAGNRQLTQDFKQPGESIAEFDKKNEISGWSRYLTALQDWAKEKGEQAKGVLDAAKQAMEVVKTGQYTNPMQLALRAIAPNQKKTQAETEGTLASEWQPVSKYTYLYGAYNISIVGRRYNQQSIYVSKPLPLASNLKTVTLTTVEKHQTIDMDQGDKAPITDIEFYLGYTKNPDPGSWKPILPSNKAYVEGELLMGNTVGEEYEELKDTIQFSFRFQAISNDTVTIRRNGEPLPAFMYKLSVDGKKIGILRDFYSPASTYTASYKPSDDAYFVDIDQALIEPLQYINDNGETGETFDAVDANYTVTLKHTPYIFREQVFSYDGENERYNQDSSQFNAADMYYPIIVRVGGVEYTNITNYTNGTYDKERLQATSGEKVFAQIGSKIYFPTTPTVDELKDITVDYYYLTTDVRLKAILRRNHAGYESITPALYNYTLRCQSYDQEVRNV
ncbi:hypothetical protein GZH47_33800 (plasmid) [Paenibacillus rhizovicinus]|uniref:Uncharacterized protein n=1 Tax=Paenibacillus rhizovicinus TaxID=2704463 RepID=A0A6C0PBV3_9BACL|nr:hypothetical protein [Paenibacillus rhizovicinus]QHW35631.1 hypothetical protein GZH47_32555 [Paenibacillus rhizovicinus]QHW35865.1 hypothetical protein GZH47_33800 [Paenibacillus rhizovicinus]